MNAPILRRPVDKQYLILADFGKDFTNDPVRGGYYKLFDNKHPGVDFKTPVGTKVRSAFSGKVVRSEFHEGMGDVVGVRNKNIVALYAHLQKSVVSKGQYLEVGELIGYSGDTGKAVGLVPHLHFELRDLSRHPLKIMVLKPRFGKIIKEWSLVGDIVMRDGLRLSTLRLIKRIWLG